MDATRIAQTAEQIIAGFDTGAHQLIDAYRSGGARLGEAARQRWDSAFEQSAEKLTAETRQNAEHARDVFGTYYTRGLSLSASGAEVAVVTLVQVARNAVERAATWQQSRA